MQQDYHVLIKGLTTSTSGKILIKNSFDCSWYDDIEDEYVENIWHGSDFILSPINNFIFPKYAEDGHLITEIDCSGLNFFHDENIKIKNIYIPNSINSIKYYINGYFDNVYFEGDQIELKDRIISKNANTNFYYNSYYPSLQNSSTIYLGNQNNIAQQVKEVYIGDQNGIAQKINQIYIGDQNNKAQQFLFTSNNQLENGFLIQADGLLALDGSYCFIASAGIHLDTGYPFTSQGNAAYLDNISIGNGMLQSIRSINLKPFYNYDIKGVVSYGFAGCSKLRTLYIPKSIEKIEHHAFLDCNSDVKIYYEGTEEEWNQIDIETTGNEQFLNCKRIYNYPIR